MSEYDDKDRGELLALCEARSVPHDGRWGEARLIEALRGADARKQEGEALAKASARRAEAAVKADPPKRCRVLPNGDGKVSTGVHIAGVGDDFYEKGDEFSVPGKIAAELQDRGLVEVMG